MWKEIGLFLWNVVPIFPKCFLPNLLALYRPQIDAFNHKQNIKPPADEIIPHYRHPNHRSSCLFLQSDNGNNITFVGRAYSLLLGTFLGKVPFSHYWVLRQKILTYLWMKGSDTDSWRQFDVVSFFKWRKYPLKNVQCYWCTWYCEQCEKSICVFVLLLFLVRNCVCDGLSTQLHSWR